MHQLSLLLSNDDVTSSSLTTFRMPETKHLKVSYSHSWALKIVLKRCCPASRRQISSPSAFLSNVIHIFWNSHQVCVMTTWNQQSPQFVFAVVIAYFCLDECMKWAEGRFISNVESCTLLGIGQSPVECTVVYRFPINAFQQRKSLGLIVRGYSTGQQIGVDRKHLPCSPVISVH